MERFDLVTPDIAAPDTENPYGYYLDEDTGVPGSPILAGWKNTIKAFFEKFMDVTGKTYNAAADEARGVCQSFESVMELVSGEDPAISAWASGTFNQNDVVMHKGLQWFVGQASTINTPGINSQWCVAKTFREYMDEAVNLGPMLGGFIPLDDYRHADYAIYYREAKFRWYGAQYEAWSLHLDGSSHTSLTSDVAKLLAQSKWAAKVTASDVAGTLTLKDYTGLSERAVNASLSGNVGDRQEDAMQRITGILTSTGPNGEGIFSTGSGLSTISDASSTTYSGPAGGARYKRVDFDSSNSTSPNPAKTNNSETRSANVAKGVWKLTIVVPSGTI